MRKMLVAGIGLFLISGLHCCLNGGAKEDRLLEKIMQDEEEGKNDGDGQHALCGR